MENLENTNRYNDDDEISLIDLFAVLIRFRKLICIGVLAVAIFAGLYLFVLPKFSKKAVTEQTQISDAQNNQISVTYTILVNNMFSRTENVSEGNAYVMNYPQILLDGFTNPSILAKNYKENPFLEDIKTDNPSYNSYILKLASDDTFTFDFDKKNVKNNVRYLKNLIILTIKISDDKLDLLNAFINAQLNEINRLYAKSAADYELKCFTIEEDPFVQKISSSSFSSSSFSSSFSSSIKKFIIAVFAAIFILIFVAFAINALENIKKDTKSMETLKKAWKSGK